MKDYYQLTMADMLTVGPVKPKKEHRTIQGQYIYTCPMCNWCVGIENDGTVHKELGFIYKRDVCKNGHEIEW